MRSKVLFSFLFLFFLAAHAQKITVATYNLRVDIPSDTDAGNGWVQRHPFIADVIRYHDFDVFGTQECKFHQLEDIKGLLPAYTYIGVGRDDGKQEGEYAAIFYKQDKFNLINSGSFWISETKDVPSKGWDAALPRVCAWAQFQDKKSKLKFLVFNVHMDHVGVVARLEGSKLILDKIKELDSKSPVIVMGDFNLDQENESYALLNTSGIVRDSYELSPVKFATNGTFNAFDINRKTDSRIDHIFVSKHFDVQRYAISTDLYWSAKGDGYVPRLPSDHYPVIIDVQLRK